MATFFAHDGWQPAEWLKALDRLAVTPPLEGIPASSKILELIEMPRSPKPEAAPKRGV